MQHREIEFRVWDQESRFFWNEGNGMSLKQIAFNFYDELFKENKLILQQYTGLKDLSGVKIFEGDWVHVLIKETVGGKGLDQNFKFVVQYRSGETGDPFLNRYYTKWWETKAFNSPFIDRDSLELETHIVEKFNVVGNIFEAQDLLK